MRRPIDLFDYLDLYFLVAYNVEINIIRLMNSILKGDRLIIDNCRRTIKYMLVKSHVIFYTFFTLINNIFF